MEGWLFDNSVSTAGNASNLLATQSNINQLSSVDNLQIVVANFETPN
jgi:hypothetical protein